MRIMSNISAINTNRIQGNNALRKAGSLEKLSSGLRINRAADDSSGLSISEKMRAQVRGLNMASKNSQDGVSLLQTAEGAMQEAHNILQRMRELSVQSSSDTNDNVVDRESLDAEFQQLATELDDIADKTEFNGKVLLDGSLEGDKYIPTASGFGPINLRVSAAEGTPAGDYVVTAKLAGGKDEIPGQAPSYDINVSSSAVNIYGDQTFNPGPNVNVGDSLNGQQTLRVLGGDLSNMTIALGDYIATGVNLTLGGMKPLNFGDAGVLHLTADGYTDINDLLSDFDLLTIDYTGGQTHEPAIPHDRITLTMEGPADNPGPWNSDIMDGGIAANLGSISMRFKNITPIDEANRRVLEGSINITIEEGTPLIIQTGANTGDELEISIDEMTAESLGIQLTDVASRETAHAALGTIEDAINNLSMARARIGSMYNRLGSKISNLDMSSESLQSAESRIRDVDMAKELTTLTKENLLSEASTSMQAQANAAPEDVLTFFQ